MWKGDCAFAAPKMWNDQLLDIKQSGSVDFFKKRLKTHFNTLAFNRL